VSEAASSRLRELRKWDLAPLGAVLVVVLLATGAYVTLISSAEKSYPDKVRAYFMSNEGGSATKSEARRIDVSICQPTGEAVRNELVISCAVSFRNRTFTGCYVWEGNKLIAGGSQPLAGCEPILWDRRTHSLLGLRQDAH
jgi:hypothetical protein